MNAQVNTNEAPKLTLRDLKAEIASVIEALKNQQKDGEAARKDAGNAIQRLRKLAIDTHEAGIPAKPVAEAFGDLMKAAGFKSGTVKPYRLAFTGYRLALADGKDINAFTRKREKDVAMTTNEAVRYQKEASMTDAEREEAKRAAAERADRDEAVKRLKALPIETIREMMAGMNPLLPEVPEAVKDVTEDAQAKAEAERRRLEAEAEEALQAALSGDYEEEEDVRAAVAG